MKYAKQVLGDRLRSLPVRFRRPMHLTSIRMPVMRPLRAPVAILGSLGAAAARSRAGNTGKVVPLVAIGVTGVAVLALATALYAPFQSQAPDVADVAEAPAALVAEADATPAIRSMTASLGTAPAPLGAEAPPPPAAASDFEWSSEQPASNADILTSAIPDPDFVAAVASTSDGVAVAESDREIAALEEAQEREVAAVLDEIRQDGESYSAEMNDFASPAAAPSGPARPARTTQFVNMRASADNDAEILSVVPADTALQVTDDCPNWCAVAHEGQSGFIYGSFLDVEDGTSVQAAVPAIQP